MKPQKDSMHALRVASNIVGRILRVVIISVIDLGLMVALAFVIIFLYAYHNSLGADELVTRPVSETTVIYDKTGDHVLYKIYGEENRKVIAHEEIPDALRNATVAIEDERFYRHFGVDVIGVLRALRANVADADRSQGGSTITQQLVRNAFLSSEKTITRKFKEMVLAVKVERRFTKDEILDYYLNEVPYGSNAYGAETAAQTFFNKEAKDLTLDEAALLAALPKATTYLSPHGSHADALRVRQQSVLENMQHLGMYDAATIVAAKKVDTLAKIIPARGEIDAPHFVFYVREELEKMYAPEVLQRGGFQIYTTLDYDMQKRAEKAVRAYAPQLPRYGASNASLVAIDPATGSVRAMVGSIDYHNKDIDGNVNVALQPRQPGSSFKPIVYAAAFEKGFQPETLLHDVKTDFGPDGSGKNYVPQNFDGSFHGLLPMRKTLAGSLNIPAVKTLYLVGLDNALDFAQKLGFTTLHDRKRYGLSLVLGGGDVKLLEEVGAFATFANNGVHADVHGIDRIIDAHGDELRIEHAAEPVMSEESARKINSILSDNDARSYVFGRNNPLFIPGKTVAAKTGTTQDFRDAWTVGYTPALAVGVWTGNNDATYMYAGSIGSRVAAPLWHTFMAGELVNTENKPFAPYTKVESSHPMITGKYVSGKEGEVRYYDLHSGKPISAEKASKMSKDKVRVKQPSVGHTILYYVNKDNPLDTNIKPDYSDPMLWRWERAIGNTHLTYQ